MHPTLNHKILESVPDPARAPRTAPPGPSLSPLPHPPPRPTPRANPLRTFVARARVEPIFLLAVAPSYEEMKLACTLSTTCFFALLPARRSRSRPLASRIYTSRVFRFCHVRATDRMFIPSLGRRDARPFPSRNVRVPRRHPSRWNPIKSDGS